MYLLSNEDIQGNKKIFLGTNKKYLNFPDEMLEFLGDKFFTAPASPIANQHNACPGGLVDHMLKSASYAMKISETILPENMKLERASVIRAAIISQLGKAHMFKPCESAWHRENQGKFYEFTDDNTTMDYHQRGVYYCNLYGVQLSEYEMATCLNFEKDNSPLSIVVKAGIQLAILEQKKLYEESKTKV